MRPPALSAGSATSRFWRATSTDPRVAVLWAVALAILIWWMASDGGFNPGTWYAGALMLLALLYLALLAIPARPPRLVVAAGVLLLAYAAWSYASITWADQKATAWEGANRTALYALIFGLFALWRQRARSAAILVGAFGLAVAAIGAIELLSASPHPPDFIVGRLAAPIGYANADVALWMMGLWPCLALGSRRELAPGLRALFVAGGLVLVGLSLLAQSRGWLFALPPTIIVFLILTRDRLRAAITLAAVALASLIIRSPVLAVYGAISNGRGQQRALDRASLIILLTALALGLLSLIAAYADRSMRMPEPLARRANRGFTVGSTIAVVVVALGALVAAGNPVGRLNSAVHDFEKSPQPAGSGTRFTDTLGSARYDFWRVAWTQFQAHPLEGIGADNFQQAYLRLRHGYEEPLYPHSVVIRTLSQTGLVGSLLLAGALAAALLAAWHGVRRRVGIGSVAAAGAAAAFLYWLIHGSIDWFWEFPALGGSAFALLGVAAALAPRVAAPPRRPPASRPAAIVAATALALVLGLSFASPWLAQRKINRASSTWPQRLPGAFDDLSTAARLNPLSATPLLVRASIALRVGLTSVAKRDFKDALNRDPNDLYAMVELGAIAAEEHHFPEARRRLMAALRLNPGDEIAANTLTDLRHGKQVRVAEVNRLLLADVRQHER